MTPALLALGSNLGDRLATVTQAVQRLRAEPGLRVVNVSPWYETTPVGGPAEQGAYLNGALLIETYHSARELLALLHRIEAQFGRVRTVQDGPRTLDLDLLFYGQEVHAEADLIVPHPRLHQRRFVLTPLRDIAPEWLHPILKKTVRELWTELPTADQDDVTPFSSPPSTAPLAPLRNQVALVTGSTSGIGASIATALERHGATVIRHGRQPRDWPHYLAAELAEPEQVARLADQAWSHFGHLDLLICNAGADTLTGEAAHWPFDRKLDTLLAVDLKATMTLTRTLGERMRQRGHGVILTVGWDQAETGLEGDSGQLFAAVKGAIMCFTRSLALSLAPEVRVNCLAPGWIRTAWGETASPLWQERVRRETPLKIWGLPEDIAEAALWLCSPAARFVTGQTLRLNGGAMRA